MTPPWVMGTMSISSGAVAHGAPLNAASDGLPVPCVQICIMEQPEEDWQMLPRQARSLSSHQLQMQRQLSQVGLRFGG